MERNVFLVKNVELANACVAFAEQLGYSVSPNINDIGEGNYLTTGSKKYNINWIRNESFVAKKNETPLDLNEDFLVFILAITEPYLDSIEEVEDEVNLEYEVPTPDVDTICALYNKVKSQKKSPAKYYVTFKNDQWVATTTSDGSFGNLQVLFLN